MIPRGRSVRLAASLLLPLLGCASSPSPGSAPPTPETQAFSYLFNLIPVDVTIAGASGQGYVDTGDPLMLLDPTTFPSVNDLPPNGGPVPSMTVASQSVTNAFALSSSAGLTSPDPAFPIGANVGCTAVCAYVAAFDYRGASFFLGSSAPTPPTGLEPETTMGFSFLGGETLDGVAIPRSRIVVTVSLEGTHYNMILDSGASIVTVSQAAFTALTADGRAQLMGGDVETTSGTSTSSLTRAASIAVGSVEVDSVVVAHDTSFDTNLAAISMDAGETIDGSLGGDFLHDFYVTVDYPSTTLHFARYSDLSFAIDEAEQIGISLNQGGSDYFVGAVSTDAAAQGITVGDQVVAIEGIALSGLTVSQATLPLYGPVGSTKSVQFGTAAQVANQTLQMVVEELLPLPSGG
jgi:hypothetical protein